MVFLLHVEFLRHIWFQSSMSNLRPSDWFMKFLSSKICAYIKFLTKNIYILPPHLFHRDLFIHLTIKFDCPNSAFKTNYLNKLSLRYHRPQRKNLKIWCAQSKSACWAAFSWRMFKLLSAPDLWYSRRSAPPQKQPLPPPLRQKTLLQVLRRPDPRLIDRRHCVLQEEHYVPVCPPFVKEPSRRRSAPTSRYPCVARSRRQKMTV